MARPKRVSACLYPGGEGWVQERELSDVEGCRIKVVPLPKCVMRHLIRVLLTPFTEDKANLYSSGVCAFESAIRVDPV